MDQFIRIKYNALKCRIQNNGSRMNYQGVTYRRMQYNRLKLIGVDSNGSQLSRIEYKAFKCRIQNNGSRMDYKGVKYRRMQYNGLQLIGVQYNGLQLRRIEYNALKCSIECRILEYSFVLGKYV